MSHALWKKDFGYGGGAVLATGFVDGCIRLYALTADGDSVPMRDASEVRSPTTVEAVTDGTDPDAPIYTMHGHTGSVQCLAWLMSPSATIDTVTASPAAPAEVPGATAEPKRWLVSGARDGQVRIWDPVPGGRGCVGVLKGHSGGVNCCAVCATTGLIVTGGDDRTAKVWDPATLSFVATLRGHTQYIVSVAVVGRLVVSAGADGTARAWFLNPDNLDGGDAGCCAAHPLG